MGVRKLSYYNEIVPKKLELISKGNTGNFSENSSKNCLDYFPFACQSVRLGMLLPNRHDPGNEYRYGFNCIEKDDEVSGEGNSYTTTFRAYDSRIGRWKSLDPLMAKYPSNSPYNSASNNPIINIDQEGDADIYFNGKWIGTDGVDDGMILLTSDKTIKKEVSNFTKEGLNYPAVNLSNGEKNENFNAIHTNVLEASLAVLDKAIDTKLTQKEHQAVLVKNKDSGYETIENKSPDLEIVTTEKGTTRSKGDVAADGDVMIHSHPIGLYDIPNSKYTASYSARKPTKYDKETNTGDEAVFKFYELNIIVGRLGQGSYTKDGTWIDAKLGIVVYNKNVLFKDNGDGISEFEISKKIADKVMKPKNEKRKAKFNKKRSN